MVGSMDLRLTCRKPLLRCQSKSRRVRTDSVRQYCQPSHGVSGTVRTYQRRARFSGKARILIRQDKRFVL